MSRLEYADIVSDNECSIPNSAKSIKHGPNRSRHEDMKAVMKNMQHKSKKGVFKCKFRILGSKCNHTFTSRHKFVNHYRTIHQHDYPFQCEECSQKFTLLQHYKQHKCRKKSFRFDIGDKNELPMLGKCPECCSIVSLRLPSHHYRVKPVKNAVYYEKVGWACVLCKDIYRSRQHIENHMRKTHKSNYSCHMCDKSFLKDEDLVLHLVACHSQDTIDTKTSINQSSVSHQPCHLHEFVTRPAYSLTVN